MLVLRSTDTDPDLTSTAQIAFPLLFSISLSHHWEERQLKSPVMTLQKGFSAAILDNIDSKFRVKLSNDDKEILFSVQLDLTYTAFREG